MWTKSLCALGVLTLSASALAQVPTAPRRTGVYVYGSIGASQGNDRSASLDRATANLGVGPIATIDGKRMVGGATIGYRMNSYFGLEAGYMDLGRMELRATDSTGAGNFTSQTKIRGAPLPVVAAVSPQGSSLRFALAWVELLHRGFAGVQHLSLREPEGQPIDQRLPGDARLNDPLRQPRPGDRHPRTLADPFDPVERPGVEVLRDQPPDGQARRRHVGRRTAGECGDGRRHGRVRRRAAH